MQLNYLRLIVYWNLMQPLSRRARQRRMRTFLMRMSVAEGMSILDLGGRPQFWNDVPFALNLTILKLPGNVETCESKHNIPYLEGDACQIDGIENRAFDIVFSNSVIEHVGLADRQADLAREVRRLGRSYWVQTPSKWFPVEAHNGMPFWWFYPTRIRRYFIDRWRRILPGNPWTGMIEETTVLSKRNLKQLFPEAAALVEHFWGIPKSSIAYFVGSGAQGNRAHMDVCEKV
jgi:Methyltransferase domain